VIGRSDHLNSSVFSGFHAPSVTLYTVRILVVVSPNSLKATLPVTPSKLTLPSSVTVFGRAASTLAASLSETLRALMMAFAAS